MSDDRLVFNYVGKDHIGRPRWSCTRVGGGIAGYGVDHKEAEADFREKEEAYVPLPKPSYIVHSSPFEPPSYSDNPGFREED